MKPNLRRASCCHGTPPLRRARTIKSSDTSCSIRKEMTKRRSECQQSLENASKNFHHCHWSGWLYCIFLGVNLYFVVPFLRNVLALSPPPPICWKIWSHLLHTHFSWLLAANTALAHTPTKSQPKHLRHVGPLLSLLSILNPCSPRTGAALAEAEILHFLTAFTNVNPEFVWTVVYTEIFLRDGGISANNLLAHILF